MRESVFKFDHLCLNLLPLAVWRHQRRGEKYLEFVCLSLGFAVEMSSSDPMSSLNLRPESIGVPASAAEASSQRSNQSASSTPRCARSKSSQGQGQGRPSRVCQILDHDIDEHVAVASVVMELFRLHSRHSWLWMTHQVDSNLRLIRPLNTMFNDLSK